MPRYRLTIAYDGTDYCGWQKQEPPASEHPELEPMPAREGDDVQRVALRTVQHVVEEAVRDLLREPVTLVGASRTDSGVHAGGAFPDGTPGGQVAAFTSEPLEDKGVGWPASRGTDALVKALNGRLPRDVLVRAGEVVDDGFDPISGAVEKEYTYCIASGPERPLWDRRFVFHTWHALDTQRMDAAAQHLVGEHDFASFAQINHGRKTTVRRIYACGVECPKADGLAYHVIRVRGNGFLYNMVRILAGTLMEVGRGALDPNRVPAILESRDRTANPGPTLPPQGLRLEWIRYG